MEKKWFVALLMVVVMMYACWTGAVADEERKTFTSGDYEYALLDDGTIEITKYNGSADHLAIPATLDGKTVTAIGDYAFAHCYSLISVSIPDSVTSIGDGAFYSCSSLTSVSIPDSVTAIESWAFYACSSLTSVSIPNSVTAIGDYAFCSCSSLTFVSIPDSVEQIGTNPFVACSALQTISVSPDHPNFSIIDGALFRKADKALIFYLDGTNSSTYTIPQGITAIGDDAFARCSSLTSVSIPDSVTSIGDYAFYGCTSLTSVSIPDSVTAIGNTAFGCCTSLTSVSIPNSVTAIGDYAFSDCPNLTLTVPRSSYAAEYAKTNNIPYTYPDANDWLNN